MSCHYCDRQTDATNMEGKPWCRVCNWFYRALQRARIQIGLLTSPVTPWRLRCDPVNHPWSEADHFINIDHDLAAKYVDTHRIGLGVDVATQD